MKSLSTYVSVAVLVACAYSLLGCSPRSDVDSKSASQNSKPITAKLLTVQPTTVPIVLNVTGVAEGAKEVEVRSQLSQGTLLIRRKLFEEGATVKAGQLLFELEAQGAELAVQQARSNLAQAHSKLQQAEREAARTHQLAEQRAASQKDDDDTQTTLVVARAVVATQQAQLNDAQRLLTYTKVIAPISGVVGRAQKSVGDTVSATDNLLTTISQIQPIWVRFGLSDSDRQTLGMTAANLRLDAIDVMSPISASASSSASSVLLKGGKLNFVGQTIDPKLGTQPLRAEFANPHSAVLPGQFVRLRLAAGQQNNVFLVPQTAIQQSDQGRFVYVLDGEQKAQVRPLQLGGWFESQWVVKGGLKAGDVVVLDNLLRIKPKTLVTSVESKTSAETKTPAASHSANSPKQEAH
jgi:membrane fusion protein (multidrug efflux system)